jgi:hypothetical protein
MLLDFAGMKKRFKDGITPSMQWLRTAISRKVKHVSKEYMPIGPRKE